MKFAPAVFALLVSSASAFQAPSMTFAVGKKTAKKAAPKKAAPKKAAKAPKKAVSSPSRRPDGL